MADRAPTRFHSGIRSFKETAAGPRDRAAIRAANAELDRRSAQYLEAVVSVLIEQRDTALERLEQLEVERHDWQAQSEQLEADHRRAVESMLSLHQKELDALTRQLELLKESSTQAPPVTVESPAADATGRQLEAVQAELEAIRADALQVQAERDRALVAVDDVRVELMPELEAARDEAIDLQARLDDEEQRADQIRDDADAEICRLNEEILELRQQLEQRLTA
jgi:chromosome segregation ATPase